MMGEYPVFEDNYKSRRDMRQVEKKTDAKESELSTQKHYSKIWKSE
jgi:hypothetical protein